jgi:CubicO group peptidase (beta-lactamase class C family)
MDFHAVEHATEEAVKQGVFPGAVILVGRGEEVIYQAAFGWRSLVPDQRPMQLSTIFDLASLTKPLATTIAIMLLVNDKKLALDDRVSRFMPAFDVFTKGSTTIRHLLTHSSGLPAWKPYYQEVISCEMSEKTELVASRTAKTFVLEQIHRERPLSEPGTQAVYSDLGFIVLGEIVETITASNLDRFCHDRIFKPLALSSTAFFDSTQARTERIQALGSMIAATEVCPWRRRVLCGEVHDDNAFVMGGVAGHAGLFSSARDIHTIIACLNQSLRGDNSLLPQSLVQEFLTKDDSVTDSTHALGWDTPSTEKSASGMHFSQKSVGHLGFTGTSIWWDLEKNCHVILLSNRVHPTRNNEKIKQFRPSIHNLIMQAINP